MTVNQLRTLLALYVEADLELEERDLPTAQFLMDQGLLDEDRIVTPKGRAVIGAVREVNDCMEAYVVHEHTDKTEGRGALHPRYVTPSKTAAARLAKGLGVMGSEGAVILKDIVRMGTIWYGPVVIHLPTKEEKAYDEQRYVYDQVLEKAKHLGLSDQDIAILERRKP